MRYIHDSHQVHNGRMKRIPNWVKHRLFIEQAAKCFYCQRECIPTDGKEMTNEEQPDNLFTIDHIDPYSKNRRSGNSYSNYLGACRKCNIEKGDDTLIDWKKRIYQEKLNAEDSITVYDPFGMIISEKKMLRNRNSEAAKEAISTAQRNNLLNRGIIIQTNL